MTNAKSATLETGTANRDVDITPLVAGCNEFAVDLYLRLAAETAGNLFFSPSSISLALAMTFAGADGVTKREMADVLRLPEPLDQVHETFRQLQAHGDIPGVEMRIANRLWGQQGFQFLEPFLKATEECYAARLEELDFANATEASRLRINAWVEEQTNDKIKDLIPKPAIGPLTTLVLTNAIYFLGSWRDEFEESATRDVPFFTHSGKAPTPMMQRTGTLSYGEFGELQVVELPYGEERTALDAENGAPSEFVMTVLLPRQRDGVKQLESSLTVGELRRWTELDDCEVDILLPKFKTEARFQLEEQLPDMGMPSAFSANADFSRMTQTPGAFFVGSVIHKAFVDVNEQGTEAAAATAVAMMRGGMPQPERIKSFVADHPFVFLIRDRATGLIHFMGRLADPLA